MLKIITNTIFFLFDLFLFIIFCLILLVPFIIVTVYKRLIIFIGKKVLKRKLIPFDGLEICTFQTLRTDMNNITSIISTNNSDNYNNNTNEKRYDVDAQKDLNLANVVGMVLTYKGEPISLESIRNLFYAKFLDERNVKPANKFINFQVKVVKFGGYLFKEKVESIDLKNQIYSVDLRDSMTLEEFCADWYVKPFNPASNGLLWEMALINSQNESYIATKIHHCLADGYTIKHIIDIFCGKEIKNIIMDKKFKFSIWENVYTAIRSPRTLFTFMRKLESTAKYNIQLKTKKDYKIRVSCGTLDLRKVKAIRAKTNVKFQCILQSLIAAAVRQLYLSKKLQIPDFAVLYGILPWPNHPFRETMTNWMSGIALISPINEERPSKPLRAIEKQFKLYHAKGLNKMTVQVLGNLVSLFPHLLYKYLHEIQATAGFSTLIFEDNYELLGRKVIHIHGMGGIQELAIVGVSISHSNKLDYTITANKQLISQQDLESITKNFIPDELNKLYEYEMLGYQSAAVV